MVSEQVYYRKWRPKTFSDVVGQPVVVKILKQAIGLGKLSHAYLFTGPRGTGKTSTARILAKSVNCINSVEGEPCNSCDICEDANKGNLVDVIEIDAASKGLVDDIRDLREQVYSHPYKAKNKVYIIDEAHMLTTQAGNAFLKILEEPPKHIIFILCTTELLKIPATIVSRCQKYDFRRISQKDLVERLSSVSLLEGIQIEKEALRTISRAASGSLRDAENILEQLVTYKGNGNDVSVADVRLMLGLTPEERAFALVKYILQGNTNSALESVNGVASDGLDLQIFLNQVIEYLRTIMLLKSKADAFYEHTGELLQELTLLANEVEMPDLMMTLKQFSEITIRPESSLPLPIEMAIVSRTFHKVQNQDNKVTTVVEPEEISLSASSTQVAEEPNKTSADSNDEIEDERFVALKTNLNSDSGNNEKTNDKLTEDMTRSMNPIENVPNGVRQNNEREAEVAVQNTRIIEHDKEGQIEASELTEFNWGKVVKELSRYKGLKYNLGALLRDVYDCSIEGNQIILRFKHSSLMEKMQEEIQHKKNEDMVVETVKQYCQEVEKLVLKEPPEGLTGSPSKTSPLVQAALGLGARIVVEKKRNPV